VLHRSCLLGPDREKEPDRVTTSVMKGGSTYWLISRISNRRSKEMEMRRGEVMIDFEAKNR
jgi:hypothetical protein